MPSRAQLVLIRLPRTRMGSGEWGVGSGEWGVGSREWRVLLLTQAWTPAPTHRLTAHLHAMTLLAGDRPPPLPTPPLSSLSRS